MSEVRLPKIFKPLDEPFRYKVMYGGRGCIHADTLIDTPNGQVPVCEFEGGEIYALSSDGIIATYAEKPIQYPKTPLYKITFDNGFSITCTENHKFLTEKSWLTCREVWSSRVPVCASFHPQTSLDTYPLALQQDAHHLTRRVLNFLYCYFVGYRQYDVQPHSEVNTFLNVLQALSDARPHKSHALSRMGGLESLSIGNPSDSLCHLSTLAALLYGEALDCEASGSYNEPKTFGQLSDLYQSLQQSLESNNPFESIRVFCDFVLLSVSVSSTHQAQSLSVVRDMLSRGVDDDSYSSLLNGCNHSPHYITPTEIEEIGEDYYYDFFVPVYNNYLTNGVVNHNSGKSWTVARKLILRAVQEPILILCTRELQKSIKQSVHRLLRDQINAMGVSAFFDITDTSIKGKNGSEFIFLGTKHNPEEIKSTEGVDVCWIEEAHNLTEASWDIINPTIRKEGSEIWVTFNTRFKFDHIYQLFIANTPPPGSWVQKVNHQDNPYFTDTLAEMMAHERDTDYEKYLHIWEGELKILAQGAIFGTQVLKAREENRFCKIPIATGSPVYTFWDLGRNDHTAIWFMQNIGKEYRMIDYYENRLKDIPHYCRVLLGQASEKEMRECGISATDNARRSEYIYNSHFMPHDIDTVVLGMDKNRKQQFTEGGIKPIVKVPRIPVKNDAIEMARNVFSQVWIDTERCEKGIECLSNYRYEYNDDRDTHNLTPFHDWSSNGADAFMQFAQGYRPKQEATPLPSRKRHIA